MNAITTDARIRIVCPSDKSLHLATGVALDETTLAGPEVYEEHAWFVHLDTPTLDGIEFIAVAEDHLVLLGDDWPARDDRAVAMRAEIHVGLSDEQLVVLARHAGSGVAR